MPDASPIGPAATVATGTTSTATPPTSSAPTAPAAPPISPRYEDFRRCLADRGRGPTLGRPYGGLLDRPVRLSPDSPAGSSIKRCHRPRVRLGLAGYGLWNHRPPNRSRVAPASEDRSPPEEAPGTGGTSKRHNPRPSASSPFRTAAFTNPPTSEHADADHQPAQPSGNDRSNINDTGAVSSSGLISAMLASGQPHVATDKGVPTVTKMTNAR